MCQHRIGIDTTSRMDSDPEGELYWRYILALASIYDFVSRLSTTLGALSSLIARQTVFLI